MKFTCLPGYEYLIPQLKDALNYWWTKEFFDESFFRLTKGYYEWLEDLYGYKFSDIE